MATAIDPKNSSAGNSRKRKRVVLTSEQKLLILDRLKKGQSQENIASEFGVGRSTVGDIKKSEGKLRLFASSMEGMEVSSKKTKVMRLRSWRKPFTCGFCR